MWGILFLIVYIFLLVLIRVSKDDLISKMILLFFTSIWLLSLFISCFNPLGLYEVSDTVYMILLINVVSFFVGFNLVRNKELYKRNDYVNKFESSLNNTLTNKYFIILTIISIIILVSAARTQMAILAIDANEMGGISTGENDVLFESAFISILYNVFIPVIFHISLFLFPYLLLVKKNKLYAIAIGILIFSRALIGGSRDSIFIIFIYFFAFLLMSSVLTRKRFNFKNLSVKKILAVVVLGIGVYLGMVFLTSLRHGNVEVNEQSYNEYSEGLQHSFVNYACGPFRGMDYGIKNHFDDYAGSPLMGLSTCSGLFDLLQLFANKISVDLHPVSGRTVQHQQDIRFNVSPTFSTFNYAYTNAMIFYYDGGVIAVIIFSFLFGLTTKLIIRMMYKNMTFPAALLVGFFIFGVYKSTFTWFLIKHWAWLYVIILIIWHHFEKKKNTKQRLLIKKK